MWNFFDDPDGAYDNYDEHQHMVMSVIFMIATSAVWVIRRGLSYIGSRSTGPSVEPHLNWACYQQQLVHGTTILRLFIVTTNDIWRLIEDSEDCDHLRSGGKFFFASSKAAAVHQGGAYLYATYGRTIDPNDLCLVHADVYVGDEYEVREDQDIKSITFEGLHDKGFDSVVYTSTLYDDVNNYLVFRREQVMIAGHEDLSSFDWMNRS